MPSHSHLVAVVLKVDVHEARLFRKGEAKQGSGPKPRLQHDDAPAPALFAMKRNQYKRSVNPSIVSTIRYNTTIAFNRQLLRY